MLQTLEAEYDNGNLHFFEHPHFAKARVLVTFLRVEPDRETDDSVSPDVKTALDTPSVMDKWVGFLKGKGIDDYELVKYQHLTEKYLK